MPIRQVNSCESDDRLNPALQLCAGQTRSMGPIRDSCHADSGGPLVAFFNNRYTIVGIVSDGDYECAGHGIYTRVFGYMQWINDTIRRG